MRTFRRSALVLGATGGLGTEIARRLVGLSSTLLVHGDELADTQRLRAELAGADEKCRVISVPADFASLRQTQELIRQCIAAAGQLDIIVNTVEMLPPRARTVTEDGNELTWQVNYLAPARIVLGLLPLLRNSPTGRIVHVVRDAHRVGVAKTGSEVGAGRRYHPACAYTESKLALMMLAQTVAARLRGSSCRSVIIQPAGIDIGLAPVPLSRGLMVDAVLYACTSPAVPNGAYLRGRRVHPLPRAAAGAALQQRVWRSTCRSLELDIRTGLPLRPKEVVGGS